MGENGVKRREFLIQWHITNRCEFDCKHCYMTLQQRNASAELTTTECFTVIDDLVSFAKLANITPRITFTGGNPLLRHDIWEIIGYASGQGVITHVLGNPTFNMDVAIRLKECGVDRYQLSFDGLENSHDALRGKGAYHLGLEAIAQLNTAGIDPVVMSTVTRMNKDEMPELACTVIARGAKRFDFARLVPVGNGMDLAELCFTPQEYRAFLESMFVAYKTMIAEGVEVKKLGTKDPLWSLLLFEKGELKLPPADGLMYTGCSIGKNGFCLDSDGTVYACRRMPVGIGNIKNSRIRDLFIRNPFMVEYRQFDRLKSCNGCEVVQVCRGCRAVAWADTGSYFGRDPQCWRENTS